jgi:hypothetical protein
MASNGTAEYKVIADFIVSPDEDIIVNIAGGVYMNSISAGNKLATMDDIGEGGGAANTGDITFDGVQIIGAGTAAGDGSGSGTIELVPDGDLNSDQYIIIDPTAPSHIHIRAGGTQDASSADLFLGGEKTNVKVSDNTSSVRISTSSENFTFVRLNENIAASNIFSNTNALDLYNAVALGWVAINPLGVTAQLQEWTLADGAYQFSVAEANFFQPATNYTFRNDDGSDGDRSWIFGPNGVLEGPADGGVSVYGLGNVSGTDLTLASSNGIEMLATNDITLASNNGDIILNPDSSAYLYSSSNPDNEIVTVGDLAYKRVNVPTSSIGQLGDVAHYVADDTSHHYFCTGTYDGETHIWKRIAWDAGTWSPA